MRASSGSGTMGARVPSKSSPITAPAGSAMIASNPGVFITAGLPRRSLFITQTRTRTISVRTFDSDRGEKYGTQGEHRTQGSTELKRAQNSREHRTQGSTELKRAQKP